MLSKPNKKVAFKKEYSTPCGKMMIEYVIVNNLGNRVSKVSGDLKQESRESVLQRVLSELKSE